MLQYRLHKNFRRRRKKKWLKFNIYKEELRIFQGDRKTQILESNVFQIPSTINKYESILGYIITKLENI